MADRLVTIFGGSGFVGRHLVQRLARTGVRIRVAVRNPNLALFLKPLGDVGQIQIVQANVRDDDSVARAVAGADAVVNLVGILYQRGRQRFDDLQADGADRIARASRAAGVSRLVHLSAIGADSASASHYARSKAAGEKAMTEAFPNVTIMRPSVVFGPEDGFFNRFATMIRMTPVLPLFGGVPVLRPGGQTKFQPVYVGDVADAIVTALGDRSMAGKVFELGGPRIYTLRQIFEIVLAETGRKRLCVSIPFGLAKIKAWLLQIASRLLMVAPLLTVDQVKLLATDNVVADDALTLADIGITPTTVEAIIPTYLWRHRRSGQFSDHNSR
ncbi:MAG: complex I NDUFA9 subunit family protein [Sphingomonadales bacterium]